MKVIPRSAWTSSYPGGPGTEDIDGLPNFRESEVKGVTYFTPKRSLLYMEKDPKLVFKLLYKDDRAINGFGDIKWNLGVAPNVEGVFCLRGLCNKSPKVTNSVTVLVLLGEAERPTDLLIQNLHDARSLVISRYPNALETSAEDTIVSKALENAPPVGKFLPDSKFRCSLSNTFTTTTSVHTHDLIESLAYWGYYHGRNDAIYGPITRQAVGQLQADLKDEGMYRKRIDGLYGRYTREAWCMYLKSLQKELVAS